MVGLEWLDREAYPFSPHQLSLGMGNLHYVDEGSGPPIVMVHGNPTWSFLYRHLIRRLSGTYRCIAPDHIGFGLSDKPPDWSYRPQDHASNLAHLMDDLEVEGITLIVQDWGGPIGLSYALDHPRKVSSLVILNTWMWPVNRDPYYLAFSGFVGGPVGRVLIRRANLFARTIMRQAYGDKRRLTKRIHQQYLSPLRTPDDRRGCARLPGEILRSTPWLRDLWARRHVLRGVPALIAWGMKDIAFREKELRVWTDALPEAEVLALEDVGHYVQEEAPDRLGEAVERFLPRVLGGSSVPGEDAPRDG
jgi:haloalkane dehalogenase